MAKYLKKYEENIDQIQSNYVSKVLSTSCKGLKTRIDVPLYQRPYTWKKDSVNVLFEDLISHLKQDPKNAYYLGQLVFIKAESRTLEGARRDILDGQQRLTTLYIFVNALINSMEKLKRDIKNHSGFDEQTIKGWEKDVDIEIEILYNHVINCYREVDPDGNRLPHLSEPHEIKFLPYYEDDKEHFNYLFKKKSIIDFEEVRDPNIISKRHKIIVAAFTLYENINKHTDEIPDPADNDLLYKLIFEELKCIKNILTGDFIEVSYTVLEPGIEFTIFETLNDRGEDLNCYHLTRNLMLNISIKDHIKKEKETINVFDKIIKPNCSPRKNFDERIGIKLMLASWNMSNEGKASAGKYMKEFISFVKKKMPEGNFERNKPEAQERFSNYLDKLKKCSYSYAELLKPHEKIDKIPNWGTPTSREKLWKRMFLFKKTNATQHYPMYLALRFKEADIDTVINYQKLIEKIYVNFILLSKKSPSLIETEMSKMAYEIYNSNNISKLYTEHVKSIIEFAKNNKIKLDEFEKDFIDLTTNNNVSTYLLLNIVLEKNPLSLDIKSAEITLEHVMPETAEFENPNDNWYNENFLEKSLNPQEPSNKKLNEEAHKLYLDRVGNHTILKNKDNIINSNKAYEDKKDIFKKYGTDGITKGSTDLAVLNFSKWDASAIKKRQKALATEAKKIWAFTLPPTTPPSATDQLGNQTQG